MPKFSIGDVVTLNTHPFSSETTDVLISGEYLMLPPLMVVVEIIDHSVIVSEKDKTDKFKCLWFSTKKNNFNESYFSESDLKKIKVNDSEEPIDIEIGNLVSLSTLPLELGKRRSFLNTETNQTGNIKNSSLVTGLLSFVSPVMTVIDVKDFDPTKDKKTAPEIKPKKIYPSKIAKCKWFDAVGEKFSECLIATNALTLIPSPPSKLLILISKAIADHKCLNLEATIVKPTQISNRSGEYHFNCFNFLTQQNTTLSFNQLSTIKVINNPIKSIAPVFKPKVQKGTKSLRLSVTVESLVKKALTRSKKNYIVIKYEDRLGHVTKRTISKYSFILGDDDRGAGKNLIKYVRAYCHLRNADRNFRLSSISEASELRLAYEK
ncbi:hypothetical protein FFF34_003160 [Inquilinus sp. KBS0705]|nr:hypothetical protein FFF34_003160 [Inquilinus sp. KBS0705]